MWMFPTQNSIHVVFLLQKCIQSGLLDLFSFLDFDFLTGMKTVSNTEEHRFHCECQTQDCSQYFLYVTNFVNAAKRLCEIQTQGQTP